MNNDTSAVLSLGVALLLGLTLSAALPADAATPIRLHPANPSYFLWRGKPTVLVTSAEHYGAVVNLDFDTVRYLDTLRRDGLNYTRIFTGAYVEGPSDFNIRENTLAPAPGRLITPWARSDQPGYAGGGNRFDLSRWDPAYFERLRRFCSDAGRRGIVVEVTLFCPFYEESMWRLSPMNAANNVNGVGRVGRGEVYTLRHADLQRVQEEMTRKIVRELNGFDNVFFEICNEPYFGGVTMAWQRRIADVIVETQAALPHKHLIAQNIANGSAVVEDPHPAVGLFNFHYASPPDAVRLNRHHRRAIGFDETGFRGNADLPYRADGWDFMMAGGALYNNLDYSFTVARPDGTHVVTEPTPGGGGPTLRAQIAALRRFIERFEFLRMAPHDELVVSGAPQGGTVRVLAEPGRQLAAYVRGGTRVSLGLNLPAGSYDVEWFDTKAGRAAARSVLRHSGGVATLESPPYVEDIAL
ncbi:MAG TPA: hypothetical protein VLH79_09000, partial [Chthonomonadales bacterium]|nr:hypothetical protein [Chthonomonadales bacterium]